MTFSMGVAASLYAMVVWEAFRGGLRRLRRREPGWADRLCNSIEGLGFDLREEEFSQLVRWLRERDLDALAIAAGAPRARLAEELEAVIAPRADGTFAPGDLSEAAYERADRLAGVLWEAVMQSLTPSERATLRAELASLHSQDLADSILEQLDVFVEHQAGFDRHLADLDRRLTPDLPVERLRLRPPAGHTLSPYELLWARFAMAPFTDRAGWLGGLLEWCEETDPFNILIVSGAGGMGKTRLALELCSRLSRQGWIAGLIEDADRRELSQLGRETVPRLLVVDYADTRVELVNELVSTMSDPRPLRSARIRIVLLVRRDGPSGDPRRWFAQTRQDRVGALLNRATVLNLSFASQAGLHGSSAVDFDESVRSRLFDEAATRFAHALHNLEPPMVPVDIASDTYRSPLAVLMAAVLAADPACGPPAVGASQEDLYDRILDREQTLHWVGCPESDATLARRAVAVATLFEAESEAEAIAHLELPNALGGVRQRTRLALWLHSLYPGPYWVNPLEPDPVGEHLVAGHLTWQVVDYALTRGTIRSQVRAVAVLGNIATTLESARGVIRAAVTEHIGTLVGASLEQEAREPAKLHGLLADAVASLVRRVDIGAAAASMSLPEQLGSASSRLAVELASTAVNHAREQVAMDPSSPKFAALSSALNVLGSRLSAVGRFDEALIASDEAVTTKRHLAASGGGEAGLADLAQALSNHANHLGAVGELRSALEAAEEATEYGRDLALRRPTSENIELLAALLSNLSNALAGMARFDSALERCEEALRITDGIGDATPSGTRALHHRVGTLALRLSDVGRWDESVHAMTRVVQLARRLATDDPAGHLATLAGTLNNYAIRLAHVGRHDEASAASREALAIYRRLAAGAPEAYLPDVAMALNTLALRLADLGERTDEALSCAEEAVELGRQLAATGLVHLRGLVIALNTCASALEAAGRPSDGLSLIDEAVGVCRQLTTENLDAYAAPLAATLQTRSLLLSKLARDGEALQDIVEAVQLRRFLDELGGTHKIELVHAMNSLWISQLTEGLVDDALDTLREMSVLCEPLAAGADAWRYADALNNLTLQLAQANETDAALHSAGDANIATRVLVSRGHVRHANEFAFAATRLSGQLKNAGNLASALDLLRDVLDIFDDFPNAAETYRLTHARTAANFTVCLIDLGRSEEAVSAANEAMSMFSAISTASGVEHVVHIESAIMMHNLANALALANRLEEAIRAERDAIAIFRTLKQTDASLLGVALCLNGLTTKLTTHGLDRDAMETIEESIDIRRRLASVRPGERRGLAISLGTYSTLLAKLSRLADAQIAAQEAVDLYRELHASESTLTGELAKALRSLAGLYDQTDDVEMASKLRNELAELRTTAD